MLFTVVEVREAAPNPRSLFINIILQRAPLQQSTDRCCVVLGLIYGVLGDSAIKHSISNRGRGSLPTLRKVFPVKQAHVSIPHLQQSKYYKQQPVKNYLNFSKEPLILSWRLVF